MGLISTGLTHIGLKRSSNQDAILVEKEHNFFMVADGMGGHRGGDIASSMAVTLMSDGLKLSRDESAEEFYRQIISHINAQIKFRGEQEEKLKGMGTTLCSLWFKGGQAVLANVGDSRAYLFHRAQLFQMTRDHSLVQQKIQMGLYDRQEAAKDNMKNVLVRTVGFEDHVEVDVYTYKVIRGDIFFLCSDGLYGRVSDHDLWAVLAKNLPDPLSATQLELDKTARELVDLANKNGGSDNISLIMVVAQ